MLFRSRLTEVAKRRDPSRLVTAASGWNDRRTGDVVDYHTYPDPAALDCPEPARASVLGEFGGLGLAVEGHTWFPEGSSSYVMLPDADALLDRYLQQVSTLGDLARSGMSGAVYTEITDVEGEVNGLLTYDREWKVDPEAIAEAHQIGRAHV